MLQSSSSLDSESDVIKFQTGLTLLGSWRLGSLIAQHDTSEVSRLSRVAVRR